MPLAVARTTDLRLAVTTFGQFAAVFQSLDPIRFDPFAASLGRAVDPIAGGELGEFRVPRLLEVHIKQTIHMLHRYGLIRAALGRHVCRILNRDLEDSLHAGVAHSMTTLEFGCFVGRCLVIQTGNTFNTGQD